MKKKEQQMKFKKQIERFAKLSEELGIELTFMESGAVHIYWENVQFEPDTEEVQDVFDAIRTLKKVGYTKN